MGVDGISFQEGIKTYPWLDMFLLRNWTWYIAPYQLSLGLLVSKMIVTENLIHLFLLCCNFVQLIWCTNY